MTHDENYNTFLKVKKDLKSGKYTMVMDGEMTWYKYQFSPEVFHKVTAILIKSQQVLWCTEITSLISKWKCSSKGWSMV